METREIFSIRKFKTGTNSARIAKLGVTLATVAALGAASGLVQADEVVVTGNPATNLTAAQAQPSVDAVAQQAQVGQQQGSVSVAVDNTKVEAAVQAAKDAGVNVEKSTTKDFGVSPSTEAVDKKVAEVQKEQESKVAEIKATTDKFVAEKEAVAKENAARDTRNSELKQASDNAKSVYNDFVSESEANKSKVKNEFSDAKVTETTKETTVSNPKSVEAFKAYETEVKSTLKDNQKAIESYSIAKRKENSEIAAAQAYNEEVRRRNAAGQKAVDEENAAITKRNEAGKKAVDEENANIAIRNKNGQDEVEVYNADIAKQNAAGKASNAEREAVIKRNEAGKKAVDEENKVIAAKNAEVVAYNKAEDERVAREKAEAEKNKDKDGYLSQVELQSLTLTSEPNARISSFSTTAKTHWNQNQADEARDYYSVWARTNGVDIKNFAEDLRQKILSNGYGAALKVGDTIDVVYENLSNSSTDGTKISKIKHNIKLISSSTGESIFVPATDPTETAHYYDNFGRVVFEFTPTYYDENGKELPITGLVSFASLNRSNGGVDPSTGGNIQKDKEFVGNFNGEMIRITGSSIAKQVDGFYYSTNGNNYTWDGSKHEVAEWDVAGSPLEYYGAIAGKANGTVSFQFGSENRGYVWFAYNSKVKASTITPQKYKEPAPLKTFTPEKVEDEYTPKTPRTFTPENPKTFTPEELKTFTPEKEKEVPTPKVELSLLNVTPPADPTFEPKLKNPETPTVHYNDYKLAMQPKLVKSVENSDNVDNSGKLVAKNSLNHFNLNVAALPANRPEYLPEGSYLDFIPQGFEVDLEESNKHNKGIEFSIDENNKLEVNLSASLVNAINASRGSDFHFEPVQVWGRPTNDGGTYENVFSLTLKSKDGTGDYHGKSNKVVIYTPGNDPKKPRNPGGEDPTPGDNLIQPKKKVFDEKGVDINGQSVLPNTTFNYIATQDLDQYKGMVAGKDAIAKGFVYIDDYKDEAIDGKSLVVNSIKAANNDDVAELLQMYHVLSMDSIDERLQKIVKDSGISPVGEFYMWVAKDPEAFYKAYVEKGLDITYNLSFKIKQSFTEGEITNQTHQIDFGNGYYGNIVTNHLPLLSVHKDVQDKAAKSIDGSTVKIGDEVVYKLEGWVIPAGRGYDVKEYRFVDMLKVSHDEYKGVELKAKVDIELEDGTVIKAGTDLSKYVETVYDAKSGKFEARFKEEFLKQIPRTAAFGADALLTAKRIASGDVENEYTLFVNGNPVVSNKVVTHTPDPEKPKEPVKPQTPAKKTLPNTGEKSGTGLVVVGAMILGALGIGKFKRKEE